MKFVIAFFFCMTFYISRLTNAQITTLNTTTIKTKIFAIFFTITNKHNHDHSNRPEDIEEVPYRLYSYYHSTKTRTSMSLHVRDSQLTDWLIVCAFVQTDFAYGNDATVGCRMAGEEYCGVVRSEAGSKYSQFSI